MQHLPIWVKYLLVFIAIFPAIVWLGLQFKLDLQLKQLLTSQPKITVRSNHPTHNLRLEDDQLLQSWLQEFEFEQAYPQIKEIIIELVDDENLEHREFDAVDHIYPYQPRSGYSLAVNNDKLQLQIYAAPDLITHDNRHVIIQKIIFEALFDDLTQGQFSSAQARRQRIESLYDQYSREWQYSELRVVERTRP